MCETRNTLRLWFWIAVDRIVCSFWLWALIYGLITLCAISAMGTLCWFYITHLVLP